MSTRVAKETGNQPASGIGEAESGWPLNPPEGNGERGPFVEQALEQLHDDSTTRVGNCLDDLGPRVDVGLDLTRKLRFPSHR